MSYDLVRPDDATRRRMQLVRQRGTAAEMQIRRELYQRGLRYRLHFAPEQGLKTRPDIVFTKKRVAVYVDGCFWHGCPQHRTYPKQNAVFWRDKIEANIARDQRNSAALVAAGWRVLRFWDHENVADVADMIEHILRIV